MGQVPPDMIDDEAEMLIWQGELKLIPSRCANLRDGLVTAFSIALDQCVPNLQKKLEQLENWDAIFTAKDPIRLFTEITNIVQGREAHQQPIYSLVQGLKMLFSFRQDSMSNVKFLEVQDALYEALVQQGCDLVLAFPGFVEQEAERIADELGQPADERLSGADNRRHKPLKDSLENSYSCGRDEYPASPTHLLTLLENFRAPERHTAPSEQQNNLRYLIWCLKKASIFPKMAVAETTGMPGTANLVKTGCSSTFRVLLSRPTVIPPNRGQALPPAKRQIGLSSSSSQCRSEDTHN
ncbi:hypothetical protein ACHAWO_006144 [Cyclotella atomus]|uniref:Uncharacterized protein n=1 Tax=Cyclotella atomus TaxID=382360 RepID=A0ABD3PK77_9STRA